MQNAEPNYTNYYTKSIFNILYITYKVYIYEVTVRSDQINIRVIEPIIGLFNYYDNMLNGTLSQWDK